MAEKVLPILEAYTSGAEASAKCMFEIVNTDLRKSRSVSCLQPGRIKHASHRLSLKGKHVSWMAVAPTVDNGSSDPVEHCKPIAAILHAAAGNDEYRGPKFGDFDLPFPSQVAYLAVSASGVDGE
jgi:hypothetical protein